MINEEFFQEWWTLFDPFSLEMKLTLLWMNTVAGIHFLTQPYAKTSFILKFSSFQMYFALL